MVFGMVFDRAYHFENYGRMVRTCLVKTYDTRKNMKTNRNKLLRPGPLCHVGTPRAAGADIWRVAARGDTGGGTAIMLQRS